MAIVLDPVGQTPQPVFPYPYSTLDYFLSKRELDVHAWGNLGNEGGIIIQEDACTPIASFYDWQTCIQGAQKSDPQPALRASATAEPRWFEVALSCSTVGIDLPSIQATAKRSLQAGIEADVDSVITAALEAVANVGPAQPSLLCAQQFAINGLAATYGDGRGIITLSGGAANFLVQQGAVKPVNGVLTDTLGNIYRTVRTFSEPGQFLYYENESSYEVWLSPVDFLPVPPDEIRDLNNRIVRAEQGHLLYFSLCGVGKVEFDCVGF